MDTDTDRDMDVDLDMGRFLQLIFTDLLSYLIVCITYISKNYNSHYQQCCIICINYFRHYIQSMFFTIRHYFPFGIYYILHYFQLTFLPIRYYVPFSIYNIRHYFLSTFFTIRHYVPFGVFFTFVLMSFRRFVLSMFFTIRRFFCRRFVPFDVLSVDVFCLFLPTAFFTSTFCQCTDCYCCTIFTLFVIGGATNCSWVQELLEHHKHFIRVHFLTLNTASRESPLMFSTGGCG